MTRIKQALLEQPTELLKFMKPRYPLFHESNVFFRDLHYGVMAYLDAHAVRYSYREAEGLTRGVIGKLESLDVLRRIDDRTWMLNSTEYKKPAVKKPEPAKPAAPSRATSGATAASTAPHAGNTTVPPQAG